MTCYLYFGMKIESHIFQLDDVQGILGFCYKMHEKLSDMESEYQNNVKEAEKWFCMLWNIINFS